MSKPRIGSVELAIGELEQPEDGVRFRMPYGEDSYDILFQDREMNCLLNLGLIRLIGRGAISEQGYDREVRLPLPMMDTVLIGLRGIDTEENNGFKQDISLSLSVVSLSGASGQEHRGILKADLLRYSDHWVFAGYETMPPLKEPKNFWAEVV